MSMNEMQKTVCPKCGAALPANAPAGLCPRCLMAMNLATQTVLLENEAKAPQIPATLPPSPAELAPHFPQLDILECLGRGGMGVVYKARQKSLDRFVALKLLAPERVGDPQFAERFTREAKALAALNHPNIVTIHDFGQAGGFYYLLMEFVDGVNLRQAMKTARFTPEQALAIVPPVCEALQYAHEHGIVHRDIKPENLLLDKTGRVMIADFGVAKMLNAESPDASFVDSQPAGTPQYMAPEQKGRHRTDHRADIYSLGVVLYELLTGELPGKPLEAPSRKVVIDVRLDEIVLRALENKPELRYQTAGEMRTQVETIVTTPPSAITSKSPAGTGGAPVQEQPSTPPRFSRVAIVGACFAALGLLMAAPVLFQPHATPMLGGMCLLFVPAAILGWIAVAQIRRSAGKLYGLWLAVFEGLLIPLLALDLCVIWNVGSRAMSAFTSWQAPAISHYVVRSASDSNKTFDLITQLNAYNWLLGVEWNVFNWVILGVAILVDWLIIRAVWRAVNKGTAPAASQTWQSPTMGWGHFIGYLQGITFTSPLAYKLANLSALGFLCFLGFIPLSGWKGFFGFSGFFGLIGLSTLIEMVARSKARRSGSNNQQPPSALVLIRK
ncbi:MAG: serine/threonine-protein kinase [Verrucomicrobiota bacterium]